MDYTPIIETLPIIINTTTGPNFYLPKKIQRVFVDFVDSLGIEVNGIPLPNLMFSPPHFITPPEPKTGFDSVKISSGYRQAKQIATITQTFPFPMTIRAISFEVDI